MIHPDGIEVYLKPAGEQGDTLKYAELPVPSDDSSCATDDRFHMRTIVLAHDEDFQVVLRCQPSFEMHAASALFVRVDDGLRPPNDTSRVSINVIQRGFEDEQIAIAHHSLYRQHDGYESTQPLRMRGQYDTSRGDFHHAVYRPLSSHPGADSVPGSIVVKVFRGDALLEDLGKPQPGHTPYDGPAVNPIHKFICSKQLTGEHGQVYAFEFRYRSGACVRRCAEEAADAKDTLTDEAALALVADEEFVRNRELDMQEREELSASWLETLALWIGGGTAKRSRAVRGRKRKEFSSPATTSAGIRTSSRRNKQPPSFCDCPRKHRGQSRRPTGTGGPKAAGSSRPASGAQVNLSTSAGDEGDKTPDVDGVEASQDLSAVGLLQVTVCHECEGVKVLKRKRAKFLREWHENNKVSADLGSEEDDPEPPNETKVCATASNAAAGGSAADPARLSSPPTMPGEAVAPAVQTEDKTADSQALSAEPALRAAVTEGESAASGTPAPSFLTIVAPEVAQRDPSTPRDQADDNAAATPFDSVQGPGPNENSALAGTAQAGDASSEKRAASVELYSAKAKIPRVDIDLTINNDEILEIKMERASSTATALKRTGATGDEEGELRDQLREIELADQRLQLQEKKMKVEAKLRALSRKKTGTPSVKAEEAIKIED